MYLSKAILRKPLEPQHTPADLASALCQLPPRGPVSLQSHTQLFLELDLSKASSLGHIPVPSPQSSYPVQLLPGSACLVFPEL